MNKKIITGILSFFLLTGNIATATEAVDYSEELAVLEALLSECEIMNIPTDYEQVNYAVIKRFESLLNEDIKSSHPATETNIGYMNELYLEAKENLEAYIAGEKSPYYINKPDMSKLEWEGSRMYSEEQPVISIGAGHFDMAKQDIDLFPDFELDNIQIEIGPTSLTQDFYGWSESDVGSLDGYKERTFVNGDYAMHFVNNTKKTERVFLGCYQVMSGKPNTRYMFGCSSKGESVDKLWISLNDYSDRNDLTASSYWKKNTFYHTTAEDGKLWFRICCEDIANVYLDDFFVYELDSEGNPVGENLLYNPGVESDDCYYSSMANVTKVLEKAEENSIKVCLLISPHYFPNDLDEDIYGNDGFIKYNINAPVAREIIKNYLDVLLPKVSGFESIDSICLTNEPTFSTMNFYDFYNPLFKEYLKETHKDISVLNKRYNSNYTDFNEIDMPKDLSAYDAVCYDWIEFNDKTFTEWHKWLAGIVKSYMPQIPVHSKVMGYFARGEEKDTRAELMRGTDIEYFNEFSDYAGNDTWDFTNDINLYYNTMLLYDYQLSVTKKPVYNSEDHIVEDREKDFSPKQRKHMRNNLWMGAVHGRSMSSIWVWAKSNDKTSALYNSIAYRPDVTAEIGKTHLDIIRNVYDVSKLQQSKPRTAIFYSKPSRLYNENHSQKLLWTYKALLNMGEKVGVVSDNSIELLSDYEVLVIPNATNCKQATLKAVEAFIKNGGKVIYTDEIFVRDEYNNALNNSAVVNAACVYNSDSEAQTRTALNAEMKKIGGTVVEFVDADTEQPVENLDWQYTVENNNLLLTVTSLEFDTTKNLALYVDGKRIIRMKECISGKDIGDTVVLEGYTPQLIKVKLPKIIPHDINTISVDTQNSLIKWDYTTDENATANVYFVEDNGIKTFRKTVTGNEYSYSKPGTYAVYALDKKYLESEGKIVTVTEDVPFVISCKNKSLTNSGVSAEIKVVNNSETVNAGEICVKVYDAEDNLVGYSFTKLTLFPKAEDSFKVMFTTRKTPEKIEIYAVDSTISNNICSNVIDE